MTTIPAEFAAIPDDGVGEIAGFPVTRTGDNWTYVHDGAWAEIGPVGDGMTVTGFSRDQEQGSIVPVTPDRAVGAFAFFAGQVRDFPQYPPT
jgi:hypothetical protein